MRESDIQRSIMIATSSLIDWYRNNVGCYDANPKCPHCGQRCKPGSPRWIHYGVGGEGGADLIGIRRADGRFVAAEIKTATGSVREAQSLFGRRVRLDGGIFVIARRIEDILEAVK